MKNLITFAILLGSSLSSQASYPQPSDVVAKYFTSLAAGDLAEVMNLLDDDVIWHQPGNSVLSGTYVGKASVGALFGRFMEISNGTFRIDQVQSIMTNGSLVSATLSFSATRFRYLELSMQMKGIDVMKIENGKIKEVFLFSERQSDEDQFWGISTQATINGERR